MAEGSDGDASGGCTVYAEFQLTAFLPYRIVTLGSSHGDVAISRQYEQDDLDVSIPEWRIARPSSVQFDTITDAADVVAKTPHG